MFPDIVTIYNATEDNGTMSYNRKVVTDVFSTTEKIISPEGHGEKYSSVHRVIFSAEALKGYLEVDKYKALGDKKANYTLQENDIVVFGEYGEISDLVDVQKSDRDYFLVKTISLNRYGDPSLHNIEVTD